MATAFDIINQGLANDTAANQQASQMKLQYALENFQMAKQQEAAIAAEGRAYTRQMDVISKQAQINAESQRKSFEQQTAMQMARDKAMDERQDSKEAAASKKAEEEARRKSKAAAGGVRAIKSQIEQMQANLQGEFSTLDQRSRAPDIAATATQQLLASGRIKPDQAVVLASYLKKGDMDAYEQALVNFAQSNEAGLLRWGSTEREEAGKTVSAYENLKQQRKAQLALQADNNFQLAKASIDDLYRQAAEVERYILPEDRDVLTPKAEGKAETAPEKPQTEADRFKATLAKSQAVVTSAPPAVSQAGQVAPVVVTPAAGGVVRNQDGSLVVPGMSYDGSGRMIFDTPEHRAAYAQYVDNWNATVPMPESGPLEEQLPDGTWRPTPLGLKAQAQQSAAAQAAAQKEALRQKAAANWYNPFAPFLGQQ